MQLAEMDLFSKRKDETLKELEMRMETRTCKPGETVHARGQPGDEIFWIRRGAVFIFAPMGAGRTRHVASFGRGDFFEDWPSSMPNRAATTPSHRRDTEVYVLSREQSTRSRKRTRSLPPHPGHRRDDGATGCVTPIPELAMLQEY